MLLNAYFDGSRTEIQSGVTVLAGYVAAETAWAELEPLWIKECQAFGIPKFHRADIFHALGRERGGDCINVFSRMIHGRLFDLLWSAVVDEDWNGLVKPPAFAARFPTSLHFCFEHIVWQLSAWGKANAPGEHIAPVFDDDMSPGPANAIYEGYRASRHHPNLIGSLTWASAGVHRMIETADLAAGELQAHGFESEYHKEGAPVIHLPRTPMRNAVSGKSFSDSGRWTMAPLKTAVLDFEERGDAFFIPS